jgi:cytochrome P450 family 142 subfamily A polypeptide 1
MVGPEIDFLSEDFYDGPAREAYAWLRVNEPVHFDARNGLWGVASYDGVVAASRDPNTFSNAGGTRPDTGPLPWMLDMDGAAHRTRRKLVSRGFTPGRVAASRPWVESICDDLIDQVCERGTADLVGDLAAPLPMIVIGDLLGVAPEDRADLLRWSDDLIGSLSGEDDRIIAAAAAFEEYQSYARVAIEARRRAPTGDLMSVIVHAEVDGERLADDEVMFEILLLLVGGDESTRHVITGGMEALLQYADERRKVIEDPSRLPAAVEEMLRWVTPIKHMTRTLTRDAELGAALLREGDKLLLLYESANFDEAHFDHPDRFDIDRLPNDHVAFGFGPHFCLGASLARLEIESMVGRLLTRLPDLELASDEPPPRFLGALQRLPVQFTPTTA